MHAGRPQKLIPRGKAEDMEITCLEVEDAGSLAPFYNAEFGDRPYCYPVSPREFCAGVRFRADADEPYRNLTGERFIVARRDGEVLGFAHLALWSKETEDLIWIGLHLVEEILDDRVGLIRFFHYKRGQRRAGQAILEEAENYFRQWGLKQIRVFSYYAYRFCLFDRTFLFDSMAHVHALLRANGYRITRGNALLDLRAGPPAEPSPPPHGLDVCTEVEEGRGDLPNATVRLLRGDEEVGSSSAVSHGHYCSAAQARASYYVGWFGTAGPEQGKGLGRYLLQVLLWEMHRIGYENATLYVALDNPVAQLLYTNGGFRLVDNMYVLFKDVERELPLALFEGVGF